MVSQLYSYDKIKKIHKNMQRIWYVICFFIVFFIGDRICEKIPYSVFFLVMTRRVHNGLLASNRSRLEVIESTIPKLLQLQ